MHNQFRKRIKLMNTKLDIPFLEEVLEAYIIYEICNDDSTYAIFM